jgi:Big-like domain-containing protein/flagellar hook capping protein FlgD
MVWVCGLAAPLLALWLVAATPSLGAINPWNQITHGACCEGNLAAWGNNTYVLAPILVDGNQFYRSTDGGRTWSHVYPPVSVSVPFGIEGDLDAWGPPALPDITVNYFGTEFFGTGVTAVSNDGGDIWTVVQVPVENLPPEDQAWIYMGRLVVPGCPVQTAPYVLTGWFRIGSLALFSCDGGLTWPVQTPLVGNDGFGSNNVACRREAHGPTADSDTRIPMASFEKIKAHQHGGWGTDGKFYWTEPDGTSLFVCKTNDLGSTWEGIQHPLASGTASPANVITQMAFDEKGTLYVLHTNKLYVSFNQGESIRYVHTLPRWGDDGTVVDGAGEDFTIDGGTIHIALKQSNHEIWYLRGDNVDTATPTWTQELVRQGGTERLDFMQIVLDGRGVPTIGYTATSGATATSSRDLDPIARDDSASTDQDQPVDIAVLDNDTDADDATLTVTQVSDPAGGTTTINPNGTIHYVSDVSFTGTDTFTYTVSDPPGLTDVATVTVVVRPSVGVGSAAGALSFRLGPISPNPFQGSTTVSCEIEDRAQVGLEVFTPAGQRVAALYEGILEPGLHQLKWTGTDAAGRAVPAGLYFVRLSSEGRSQTSRLLRVR